MKITIIILSISLFTFGVNAESSRLCNNTLIDDVNEMAFGDHGIPFTGVVKCYYDQNEKHLHYQRVFKNGKPDGTHYCYARNGENSYALQYKNGKKLNIGYYNDSNDSWSFSPCTSKDKLNNYCKNKNFKTCYDYSGF